MNSNHFHAELHDASTCSGVSIPLFSPSIVSRNAPSKLGVLTIHTGREPHNVIDKYCYYLRIVSLSLNSNQRPKQLIFVTFMVRFASERTEGKTDPSTYSQCLCMRLRRPAPAL